MTTGLAVGIANAWLNGLCRGTAWAQPAAIYVKLHTGDPGATGAANPATETRRVAASFSPASGGTITTTAACDWLNVAASETYSHVSFWDTAGPTGGAFLASDNLNVARPVVAGDNFQLAAGDIDLDLTFIAA